MPSDHLSTLCVSLLTQLLDLSTLEELQDVEREGFVSENVDIEDNAKESKPDMKEENDGEEKKDEKSQVKRLFMKVANSKKGCNRVFGCKLSEETIQVIILLMEHLKKYTETEGLFRISGNKKRQDELKEALNKGVTIDFDEDKYSPHDIATVMKQFFAELPEPLLTQSLYNCYKQVAELDGTVNTQKRIQALRLLFLLLPPPNRLLLKKLIELLHLVSINPLSKMNAYNLGIVFSPNIIYNKKPLLCLNDYADHVEPLTEIVDFIIQHGSEVFKVPDDLLKGSKEYLDKILSEQAKDAEVPMTKRFCLQINERQYRDEAMKITNTELMKLYASVMMQPDGPVKQQFLDKFRKNYPGTPPFIPQKIQLSQKRKLEAALSSPSKFARTPLENDQDVNSSRELDDHNFLSTPEKKKLFSEGDLGQLTPDHILENCPSPRRLSRTSPKDKRKRFRRPSFGFGRPSFGLSKLARLSTPELMRKFKKAHQEIGKPQSERRPRSKSTSGISNKDIYRRISLPFLSASAKKHEQHVHVHKRRLSIDILENKTDTVDSADHDQQKEVKNINDINSRESATNSKRMLLFEAQPSSGRQGANRTSNPEEGTAKKLKPTLRAPLLDIKTISRPNTPFDPLKARQETLSVSRELSVEAYKPRRETLQINTPLMPFRPKVSLEGIGTGLLKREPVLEAFRPRRSSILIDKKSQPMMPRMPVATIIECKESASPIGKSAPAMTEIDRENQINQCNTNPLDHKTPNFDCTDLKDKISRFEKDFKRESVIRTPKGSIKLKSSADIMNMYTRRKSLDGGLNTARKRRMSTGSDLIDWKLSHQNCWDDGRPPTFL